MILTNDNARRPAYMLRVEGAGFNLKGVDNGELVRVMNAVVERAEKTPIINHHELLMYYTKFLPEIVAREKGVLPLDCRRYITVLYDHLNAQDKAYVQQVLVQVREEMRAKISPLEIKSAVPVTSA